MKVQGVRTVVNDYIFSMTVIHKKALEQTGRVKIRVEHKTSNDFIGYLSPKDARFLARQLVSAARAIEQAEVSDESL